MPSLLHILLDENDDPLLDENGDMLLDADEGSSGRRLVDVLSTYAQPELTPRRPIQPIWDRVRQIEAMERARKNAPPAGPPPMPPSSIFREQPKIALQLDALPDFSKLVPGDWHDVGVAAEHALDLRDLGDVGSDVDDMSDIDDMTAALQQLGDQVLAAAMQNMRTA